MSPALADLPNNRQQPATVKRVNQNTFLLKMVVIITAGYQMRIVCDKGVERYSSECTTSSAVIQAARVWDRPTPRLLCCDKAIANVEIFYRIKFSVRK